MERTIKEEFGEERPNTQEENLLEPIKIHDPRRRCLVANSEGDQYEDGYFHMWFIPPEGWPKALVELENGKMIAVGYRKIRFIPKLPMISS